MAQLTPIFLTIHILTAIAAFGPVFVFPVIARMAAQEPQHGLFALRLTDKIEKRLTIPLALTMPISGGLLVWSEGIDLAAAHWLLTAIALYVVAISFAIFIQVRTVDRMIELATGMAAARSVLAAGPGAALAIPLERTGAPNGDPAAEMAILASRAARGGILLTILVVTIVSLMAGKPTI
jgi:uncharacterized membrane protein